VHFVVKLRLLALLGEQGDGIVVSVFCPVNRADEEIAGVLLGESADEIPSELIAEERAGCGGFGPEE
jgi:hypothetical protein